MRLLLSLFLLIGISLSSNAQSIEDYISENLPISQCLMRENNIPASIILAVAIHESAAGKSKVASHLNNHFGIKGKNSNTVIKSAYKDYEQVEDSYKHFIEYLITKKQYQGLFTRLAVNDYKSWARGIHRGGYAASKTWASQIIATVQRYNLNQYDDAPAPLLLDSPAEVDSLIVTNYPDKAIVNVYVVKKGDNLSKIAKKLATSVTKLKSTNNLKSTLLKPGQKLKYE